MATLTAPTLPASNRWSEPTRAVPLRWGTYMLRYRLGLTGLIGVLAVPAAVSVATWVPDNTRTITLAVGFGVVGAALLPAPLVRRTVAGVMLAAAGSGLFLADASTSGGLVLYPENALPWFALVAAAAVGTFAWVLMRARSAWAAGAATLTTVLACAFALAAIEDWVWQSLLGWTRVPVWELEVVILPVVPFAAVLVGAWFGRWLDPRLLAWHSRWTARRSQDLEDATARGLCAQAEQVAAWQQAWEATNPGQPMPPAPVPAPTADRTNTPALLALIFGLLGSAVVAVVLGHVALGQIRRTGERGRGMAIAGLVLGYVATAGWVVLSVIWLGVLSSLSQ